MKCLRCHQDNPSQAKFCLECGASAREAVSTARVHAGVGDQIEGLSRSLTQALEREKVTAELLRTRTRELAEAQEQQTVTADILRVIASSPTDLQPVFDTIVERALRLCDGLYSGVYQLDGDLLRLVAHNQTGTEAEAMLRGGYPRPLSREGLIGRAILERRVIHVSDIESDPDASEWSRSRSRLLRFRSFLGVPMLRGGDSPLAQSASTGASRGRSPTGRSRSSRPSPTRP